MDGLLINNLDLKALFSNIPKPDTYADIASLALVAASSVAFALRGSAWDKPDPNGAIYFERVQDGQDGLTGANETRNINQRLQELVSLLEDLINYYFADGTSRIEMLSSSGVHNPARLNVWPMHLAVNYTSDSLSRHSLLIYLTSIPRVSESCLKQFWRSSFYPRTETATQATMPPRSGSI